MIFSNKAMQAIQGFGIQLNKNSFGLVTTQPLSIPLLNAGQPVDNSLPLNCTGAVQKINPLTNIQVAIKKSIDIYFCIAPLQIFFFEDGKYHSSSANIITIYTTTRSHGEEGIPGHLERHPSSQ